MAASPTLISPKCTAPKATMESAADIDNAMETGDITPPITEVDCVRVSPMDSPMSNSGTLKARKYKQKMSPRNTSPRNVSPRTSSPKAEVLKVPYRIKKESSVPQVKADTAKVMEMFLKRRSKSLNDAVLTKEYFEREKRKKRPTRITVAMARTTRASEEGAEKMEVEEVATFEKVEVEETRRRQKSPSSRKTGLTRGHDSYLLAMEHPINTEFSGTENAADDELSSPEEGKSRSAPSTLRMQITKVNNDELQKLRHIENGSVTLTRDRDRKDRREVKRKKSLLDKAKSIIRSPSTQRKHIGEEDKSFSNSMAKDQVHHEMKKTGFTTKLKRTFSRKENRKPKEDSTHHKGPASAIVRPPRHLEKDDAKEKHSKIWPFKRRSKKSVSTPTDESAAGASDTASLREWQSSSSISSTTHSLNITERRKLMIDIRRGVHLRRSGTYSDSGILDSSLGFRPPKPPRPHSLHQDRIGDSTGSLASSEGSDRKPDRPTSLIFRERRAERQRRGLNNVFNLESTTPGLIRRDTDTRQLVYSMSLSLASDIESDGLADESSTKDKEGDDERRMSRASLGSSWTSSTWDEMSGASGSDVPFDQRTRDEQEEFFKRIADRLAQIGDQVLQDYEIDGQGDGQPPPPPPPPPDFAAKTQMAGPSCATAASVGAATGTSADLTDAIGHRIQSTVDGISRHSNQRLPLDCLKRVIMDSAYSTFQDTVQNLIGNYPNMEQLSQLALVFYFTKQACKVAQSVGQRASKIKENSITYIGNRFAAWIDSQGGWGGVLDSESEDSVEESEID